MLTSCALDGPLFVTVIVKFTASPTKTFPLASDDLTTSKTAKLFTFVLAEVTLTKLVLLFVTVIVLLNVPSLVALNTNMRFMLCEGFKTPPSAM